MADQITARGDDGCEYTIVVRRLYYQAPGGQGFAHTTGLETSDGKVLERLARGEYRIVETGQVIRSDHPDAF